MYFEMFYFMVVKVDSPGMKYMQRTILSEMKNQLGIGKEDLLKKLTPDYHLVCKRVTPSDAYIKSRANISLNYHYDYVSLITD